MIAVPKVVERADDSECYCRKAEAAIDGWFQAPELFEAWLIVRAVALYLGFAQGFRRIRQKRKFRPASITLSLRSDLELMPPLVVGTALLMT